MAYEEKRAWIMLVVSVCAYLVYLVVITRRANPASLAEVPYAAALLWTIGAALAMSLAELDHFWIANVIYLAFVLSAIIGSVAKIFAYRRGFQSW
jgi:hypothetical protein